MFISSAVPPEGCVISPGFCQSWHALVYWFWHPAGKSEGNHVHGLLPVHFVFQSGNVIFRAPHIRIDWLLKIPSALENTVEELTSDLETQVPGWALFNYLLTNICQLHHPIFTVQSGDCKMRRGAPGAEIYGFHFFQANSWLNIF